MKKTAIVSALAITLGTVDHMAVAGDAGITGTWNSQYVFSMFSPGGAPVGTPTPPQDWVFDFDAGTVDITNTVTFFGSVWTAHDVTFVDNGDGTYSGTVGVPNMLFDWSVNTDIPVEIVWDINETTGEITTLSSVIQASSPAFPGFQPYFDAGPLTILCEEAFFVTAEDEPIAISISDDILSTCSFVDGTAVLGELSQPANGSLGQDGDTLTYTPNGGYTGSDTFTYKATDDSATSPDTLITIQVGGELQGNFTMLDSNGATFGGTNDIEFTFAEDVDVGAGTGFNTDESDINFGKLTIESTTPQPFNGFLWTAHHVRVFGPGEYAFDTGCDVATLEATGCPAGQVGGSTLTMTVGPDQIGAHILFDWSNSTNIDVVNVWSRNAMWDRQGKTGDENKLFDGPAGQPPHPDANWQLVSTDVTGYTDRNGVLHAEGDGYNGSVMVDGPFEGFYANFSYKPDRGTKTEVLEISSGDTKIGSGLASLSLDWLMLSGLFTLIGLRRYRG